MKNRLSQSIVLVALMAFAAIPGVANAQQEATPKTNDLKIGVVNIQKVFEGYDRQKQESAALEVEWEQARTKLEESKKELDAKADELVSGRDSMTAEERQERQDELQQEAIGLEAEASRRKKEFEAKRTALIKKLTADVQEAIQEIGREDNYHLILEANPDNPLAVLYYHTAIDISPKVIIRLNASQGPTK